MTTVKIKRGKVRMGRTMFKAGIFLPWAVMRPSRKADQITVTTSEVDPSTPYEAATATAAYRREIKVAKVLWFWVVPGFFLMLIAFIAWPLFLLVVGCIIFAIWRRRTHGNPS